MATKDLGSQPERGRTETGTGRTSEKRSGRGGREKEKIDKK